MGGPLFWLAPVCSWEELWFLVVLDSDSYYPAYSLGLRALVMLQGAGVGHLKQRLVHSLPQAYIADMILITSDNLQT